MRRLSRGMPPAFLAVLATGCVAPRPEPLWVVESITETSDSTRPGHAESVLRFAEGWELAVPLTLVSAHDRLEVPSSPRPWILLSGVSCSNCDANELLYLIRADTVWPADDLIYRFDYPGTFREAGIDSTPPFYESRLFVGECLPSLGGGVFVIRMDRDSVAHMRRSVRFTLVGEPVTDSVAPWTEAIEATLLDAAEGASCEAIAGKEQYVF